jgi:hypothetical protein
MNLHHSTGGTYIFLHSTLMDEGELEKALKITHPFPLTPYILKGWRRVPVPGPKGKEGYNTLIHDPNGEDRGDVGNFSIYQVRLLIEWETDYNLVLIGKYRGWKLYAFLWKKPIVDKRRNSATKSKIEPLANTASDKVAVDLKGRYDAMIKKIHRVENA